MKFGFFLIVLVLLILFFFGCVTDSNNSVKSNGENVNQDNNVTFNQEKHVVNDFNNCANCGKFEHCVNNECVEEPLVPCESNEKRINGKCVLKTCDELGGLECSSGFSCSKETINSSNSNACCVGSCVVDNSCDFVFCEKNEYCLNGECIKETNTNVLNVLLINYFTPTGRKNINESWTSVGLNKLKNLIDKKTNQILEALTSGTAFHKYKNSNAKPFINYKIYKKIEIVNENPVPTKTNPNGSEPLTDYYTIMNDTNICDYVDNKGVKEVWLWEPEGIGIIESNQSMGRKSRKYWNHSTYGDVSNSYQENDLPTCENTYTVFTYNENRWADMGVHNHMHQFEWLFNFVNRELFWNDFVDGDKEFKSNNKNLKLSCGWTHCPPNTLTSNCFVSKEKQLSIFKEYRKKYPNSNDGDLLWHYFEDEPDKCKNGTECLCTIFKENKIDYSKCAEYSNQNTCVCQGYNLTSERKWWSDCETWNPDNPNPNYKLVNCHTWYGEKCDGTINEQGEIPFHVWWMQNIPGKNNNLTYNGKQMRNWWEFILDFDNALKKGKKFTK